MPNTVNAQPSIYPADTGTMAGMFRLILRKFLETTDDMLPARVVAYDRDSNRAQVQPMLRILTTQNELQSRAVVASVPVFQMGAGGFILSYPVNPGDLGWIKASDRDISVFLQSYAESGPGTLRQHSFQDAVFIPDPMHGYTIDELDADKCTLQSLDGTVKITLSDDTIHLRAPNITIECTDGDLSFSSSTPLNIVSPSLSHNGVNIGDDHIHSGVTTGGGNTGAPV